MNWEFWVPLILGSSVLTVLTVYGLELGKSKIREVDEHNKKIILIYRELKTVKSTLENENFPHNLDPLQRIRKLPTVNVDYLSPYIWGRIKFETLHDLQQVQENIHAIRESFQPTNRDLVKTTIGQIKTILEELKNETKRRIFWKPKLD